MADATESAEMQDASLVAEAVIEAAHIATEKIRQARGTEFTPLQLPLSGLLSAVAAFIQNVEKDVDGRQELWSQVENMARQQVVAAMVEKAVAEMSTAGAGRN